MSLEENIDRVKKDYRVLSDSYMCLKADSEKEK